MRRAPESAIGWMSSFRETSPTDAVGVGQLARDAFDARSTAGDERHVGAVVEQASDQGQSEARTSHP